MSSGWRLRLFLLMIFASSILWLTSKPSPYRILHLLYTFFLDTQFENYGVAVQRSSGAEVSMVSQRGQRGVVCWKVPHRNAGVSMPLAHTRDPRTCPTRTHT